MIYKMVFLKKKFYSALKQRYLQFIMINARLCSATSHHCISGPRRLKRDLLQTDSSAHVWQSAQWDISMNLTETTSITQGCYWSLVLMCACSTVRKSLATPLFNVLLPRSQPFMSVLKWSPATVLQAFFQSYPLDNFETTTTEKLTNHSMVCSVFSKKLRKLG